MAFRQTITAVSRALITLLIVLSLGGCEYIEEFFAEESEDIEMEDEDEEEASSLIFGATKNLPWLPWFFAAQEDIFDRYNDEYNLSIQFKPGAYEDIIEQFAEGDIHIIAITNIDAIARFVKREVEVDVILVGSYSNGNDTLLLPSGGDSDLAGKSVAVKQFSASHYLLDRYLLKNQINFDEVVPQDLPEAEAEEAIDNPELAGVVTWNPWSEKLVGEKQAKILFSSNTIPREILHLLVVKRDVLEENPRVGRGLLATWITVMESLRGGQRNSTLDAMAEIMEVDRTAFERQMSSIVFTDTATKALSTIRDRRMKKTMRHIHYFMSRHNLIGDVTVSDLVSYPGRTKRVLHFNAKPLQEFTAAPEIEEEDDF